MTKPEDQELRSRAEAVIARRAADDLVASSQLLNELEVHRVELELQNEELRSAREATEAALVRYTEVFDFAPETPSLSPAATAPRSRRH